MKRERETSLLPVLNEDAYGEIFTRLAHCVPVHQLVSLRLVSRAWARLVLAVPTLLFVKTHSNYRAIDFILRLFPLARTIAGPGAITELSVERLSVITTLIVTDDGECCSVTLRAWTGLRRLVCPELEAYDDILAPLSRLVELDICANGLNSSDARELLALHNLERLRIRRTANHSVARTLRHLPRLRYLDSDCTGHFVGYTGSGVLQWSSVVDPYASDEDDEDDAFILALSAIFPWPLFILLDGDWIDGVFGGTARVHYGDGLDYEGRLVDNRRCD